MDADKKRLIELVVEAAKGQRFHGEGHVVFVTAEDALLLRRTQDIRIGCDGPQVGGETHCTDFYYFGYHFRHVYSYEAVAFSLGRPC